MYQFSGSKSMERYITNIVEKSKISVFLKLQFVKSLVFYEEDEEETDSDEDEDKLVKIRNKGVFSRNRKRQENAYKLLNSLCMEFEDLSTPCKVEAVCLLMKNGNYVFESLEYF